VIALDYNGRTARFPTWAMLRTLCLFREYFETWPWQETHVVDVGACVGSVSLAAALEFKCHVTAFEPWGPAWELLLANLDGLDCTLLQAAASNRAGTATMRAGRKWGMSSLHGGTGEPVLVHTVRLDDWPKRPVTLLKLDVEGHELEVLQGARDILTHDRPRLIVELAPEAQAAAGRTPDTVRRYLESQGYRPVQALSGVDWLYAHEAQKVERR
jgi:FkbM family methyltransferase